MYLQLYKIDSLVAMVFYINFQLVFSNPLIRVRSCRRSCSSRMRHYVIYVRKWIKLTNLSIILYLCNFKLFVIGFRALYVSHLYLRKLFYALYIYLLRLLSTVPFNFVFLIIMFIFRKRNRLKSISFLRL